MTAPYPGKYDVAPAVEWLREHKADFGPGGTMLGRTDEAIRWHVLFWTLAAIEVLHREADIKGALAYLEHAAGVPARFEERSSPDRA